MVGVAFLYTKPKIKSRHFLKTGSVDFFFMKKICYQVAFLSTKLKPRERAHFAPFFSPGFCCLL